MAAVFHPISIEQGSAYEIVFYYTDQNGSPIDITNYCVSIQFKTNTDIISFTNKYKGNNYSLKSNSDGTIIFKLPARITNTYLFDNAVYDLDIQEPNEDYVGSGLKTYRLVTGSVSMVRRNTDVSLVDCANLAQSENTTDNCDTECGKLDLYSVQYGSGNLSISGAESSNVINTTDTRLIENIEIAIDGLRFNNPQDLILILLCPNGDQVLLSANTRIQKYAPGFSFMFSNRAPAGNYLFSIESGQLCQIKDKTSYIKYNNNDLLSSFDTLINNSVSGNWRLVVLNPELTYTGSIDSWKLIITYKPNT
jgi:subtilisin-like proprotein convertase family protein